MTSSFQSLEFWLCYYKHWNCGHILINILKHSYRILPLQTFVNIGILPFFYKYWNSDLILPNIGILALFL